MNSLPKLLKLEKEAADFGFKWDNSTQIMSQILSECSEVKAHLHDENKEKMQEEIGDLLHAIYSLCVFNNIDPSVTLENSIDKFERRFRVVQKLAKEQGHASLKGESFEHVMKLWDRAKSMVG